MQTVSNPGSPKSPNLSYCIFLNKYKCRNWYIGTTLVVPTGLLLFNCPLTLNKLRSRANVLFPLKKSSGKEWFQPHLNSTPCGLYHLNCLQLLHFIGNGIKLILTVYLTKSEKKLGKMGKEARSETQIRGEQTKVNANLHRSKIISQTYFLTDLFFVLKLCCTSTLFWKHQKSN